MFASQRAQQRTRRNRKLFAPKVSIALTHRKIDIGKIDNRILMLNGRFDPIIPLPNAERLAQVFQSAGAEIDLEVLPSGHELTPRDVAAAGEWLAR